ncbi:MAG: hypothetical protein ACK5NA_01030 [Enterococcus sp.]
MLEKNLDESLVTEANLQLELFNDTKFMNSFYSNNPKLLAENIRKEKQRLMEKKERLQKENFRNG